MSVKSVCNCIECIDKLLKSKKSDLKKLLKKAGFIKEKYTADQIETIEEDLLKIFEDSKLELFKDFSTQKDLEKLLKLSKKNFKNYKFEKVLSSFFNQLFEDNLKKLTSAYIKSIDKELSFKVFTKETTNFISGWSEQLSKLIKVNSKDSVEKIINQGLKNGDSVVEVAQKLDECFSFGRDRAKTIAMTEMLRAHSYAKNEAFTQMPCVTEIVWKHSGSAGINPRQHHVSLDGTTVKKGEKFEIVSPKGIYFARFPRDVDLPASETVRCHCTHSAVIDSNILGLSKDEKKKLQSEAIEQADKDYEN